MTCLCRCISNCCSLCTRCCGLICDYCFFNWFSIACLSCCCCLLGMAFMLLIMYLYYSVAVYPGTAEVVIPEAVYQYENEYPMAKREVRHQPRGSYVEENYYYDVPGSRGDEDYIARQKRDKKTSTANPSTAPKRPDINTTGGSSATQQYYSTDKSGVNVSTSTSEPSNAYQESGEEELDFKLSNNFVNSIHAEAGKNRIKEPLGLCRNNEDIKTPEMNFTLFPLEQAQEIITCINDILKNQSKKHLCIELNEEMSAFLKWLILTGESKERRKQIKITAYRDDFLFPSTCGPNLQYVEALTESIVAAPQQSAGPGTPVAAGPPDSSAVLTTCAPVIVPAKSAGKKTGKS